jgi:hypothetical protein
MQACQKANWLVEQADHIAAATAGRGRRDKSLRIGERIERRESETTSASTIVSTVPRNA